MEISKYIINELHDFGFKDPVYIGKGSTSIVAKCTYIKTNEIIAVKIIRKCKLNKKTKDRLHQEIEIMKLLRHTNLIEYRGCLQTKNCVFLFQEYAEGGELYDILERHKLYDKDVFLYFSQLVEAIKYLHSKNICHRDIKPENILLTKNQRHVKITDFGLSTFCKDGETCKTKCGSPHYVSCFILN